MKLPFLRVINPAVVLPVILLFSCGKFEEKRRTDSLFPEGENANSHELSPRITLDVDGDGKPEKAEVILLREENGNPVEGGEPAVYAVAFENGEIPLLRVGCCEGYLISEGDLNATMGEEFSLVQAPINGCTYTLTCFTYDGKEWKTVMDPILIPTACEGLSVEDLEGRIVMDGETVYFYENDPNDEAGGLIRKRLTL